MLASQKHTATFFAGQGARCNGLGICRSLLPLVALVAGLGLAVQALALDPRFKDADGDLVADPPTDPQVRRSARLIFAYTPVEDPAVYPKVWDGFLKHLEKTTGKRVQFFPVQSNAAQIEAMRSGRLHVAGFNTGGNADRGELRGLRAVRDDGREGRHLRLRDGNHRSRPRHRQGRPTSRARRSRSPTQTSNPASRRRRRS